VTAIRPPAPIRISSDFAFASIDSAQGHGTSFGSQKSLVAAAAVLLVLGGALGGYWFTKRGNTVPNSAAPQQATNVPQAQETPAVPRASVAVEPAPVSLNTTVSQGQTDIFAESRPPVESAVNRVQLAITAPARTVVPAVRRNKVAAGEIKAPKLKNIPVRAEVSEPAPMMIGVASNLSDSVAASTLLEGTGAGPAPPPGSSRPAIGGQLQLPQLISSTQPIYPSIARAQNLQGVVVLDVRVDETGKVVSTNVIAGPAPLVPAAQDAVQNWKYQPARLNGKPIAVNTKVSVRFSLH
jgi:TonB family protein